MSRIAWIFYDPVLDESYSLPVNPNSDNSSIGISKNIPYSVSSASYKSSNTNYQNVSVILDTVDEVKRFIFSGLIYSETEFNNFLYWANKQNYIEITDDLSRTFQVYIKSFKLERVRSARFPWKHKYSMETVVRGIL
jgi:hypothetical protein